MIPAPPLIDRPGSDRRARALPWLSVVAGSLVATAPVVATLPLMPPFGLLMLLGWRLLAPLSLRIWAPGLLGLADDLVSGQPLGSAMLLWQLTAFAIDLVDRRTIFRDFWQDWLIASGLIAANLVAARFLATPFGAHVDTVLVMQAMIAILAFPLAARTVAWIDRRRGAA